MWKFKRALQQIIFLLGTSWFRVLVLLKLLKWFFDNRFSFFSCASVQWILSSSLDKLIAVNHKLMLTILGGYLLQFLRKNLLNYHHSLNIQENKTGQYLWKFQRLGFPHVGFSPHRWSKDECQGNDFWWRSFDGFNGSCTVFLVVDAFLDD